MELALKRKQDNIIYSKKYYEENKDYFRLYNYRKRILEKLNFKLYEMADLKEYAKEEKKKKLQKKITETLTRKDGKILVYFD